MTDEVTSNSRDQDANLDLTQAIRQLKLPEDDAEPTLGEPVDARSVLLIARDRDITKWARRWLEREDLTVTTVSERDLSIEDVVSVNPDVIVVEAVLCDPGGRYWVSVLSELDGLHAPIIALCSGSKELGAALDAQVYEIVRKPYEWRLLGNRARRASRRYASDRELSSARVSLAEALRIAESARSRLAQPRVVRAGDWPAEQKEILRSAAPRNACGRPRWQCDGGLRGWV